MVGSFSFPELKVGVMERSDAIELEGMNFGAVLKKKEKLPTMLLMFLQPSGQKGEDGKDVVGLGFQPYTGKWDYAGLHRWLKMSNKEPGQYLEDVGTDPSLYEAAEVKQVQHTEGAGVADLCTGRVCVIGLLDKMDPFHKDQLGVLEAVALRLAATTEEEVPVVWVDAAQ